MSAPYPNVSIEEAGFEEWVPAPGRFRLLFSAQAWHWVAPEVRYRKAHEVLDPAGAIALFWNRQEWADAALRTKLNRVYQRHASGTTALGPSALTDRSREIDEVHLDEIAASGLFEDVTAREYAWDETYATARYLRLLSTHSDHRMVPEDVRAKLLAAVANVIDAAGGEITLSYETKLYLARPVRGA